MKRFSLSFFMRDLIAQKKNCLLNFQDYIKITLYFLNGTLYFSYSIIKEQKKIEFNVLLSIDLETIEIHRNGGIVETHKIQSLCYLTYFIYRIWSKSPSSAFNFLVARNSDAKGIVSPTAQ